MFYLCGCGNIVHFLLIYLVFVITNVLALGKFSLFILGRLTYRNMRTFILFHIKILMHNIMKVNVFP